MKSSDKTWSTGGGNGSSALQDSCLENPMNNMKRQKSMPLEDEPPRLERVLYVTGEERRALINSSRKKAMTAPKQNQCLIMAVSGGESKIRCSKEQYCIGTWNLRSMNQGKLNVIKQKMAEKEMATHSSILAYRIPWTEEPGGLLSIGSHRVGLD